MPPLPPPRGAVSSASCQIWLLGPTRPPHFAPPLLWDICTPDLCVLFWCGHESTLLEPRHEKFFSAHNPHRIPLEWYSLSFCCFLLCGWKNNYESGRQSKLLLHLQVLCLARLLACTRCSAKVCWIYEIKKEPKASVLEPGSQCGERGDEGGAQKSPDVPWLGGVGALLSFLEAHAGGFNIPCPPQTAEGFGYCMSFLKKLRCISTLIQFTHSKYTVQ